MRRALVLAVLLGPANAAAFDVTLCYQTVPAGQVGILRNDLLCDGSGGPNVNISRGGTLELNGHTIDGGYIGVSSYPGGQAKLIGPGEIKGAHGDPFGCAVAPESRMSIDTVLLNHNERGIVTVYDFPLKLDNVTITSNAAEGITSYLGRLSGIGPGNGRIKARNVTIASNGGDGIEAFGTVTLQDSAINENGGAGLDSRGVKFFVKSSVITNNALGGVVSGSPKRGSVAKSDLNGNGPDGDVAAPMFIHSTCEHSVDTDSGGGTLGICSGD
jgi:hypothetical protein